MITANNHTGTLNALKQGISLQSGPIFATYARANNSNMYVGTFRALPIMHDSEFYISVLSGTSARASTPNSFDDVLASDRLKCGTTQVIDYISFKKPQVEFGQYELYQASGPFSDKENMSSMMGTLNIINGVVTSSDVPIDIAYKSIRREGQLDGRVSILFDPMSIDLRNSSISRRSFLAGTLMADNTGLANSELLQGFTAISRGVHESKPFIDTPQPPMIGKSMQVPLGIFQANTLTLPGSTGLRAFDAEPFTDTASLTIDRYDNVFSSKGFGLTVDPAMIRILSRPPLTSSRQGAFYNMPDFYRTSCAGFTYTIPHLTGSDMGTDSLAYGGLKK